MHTFHKIIALSSGFVAMMAFLFFPSVTLGEEQIHAGRRLSVRQRLQRAIDISYNLYDKARQPTKEEIKLSKTWPQAVLEEDRCPPLKMRCSLNCEVIRYEQFRPWTRHYYSRSYPSWHAEEAKKWPTPTDIVRLRELLSDEDPAMRCMAVEALATLRLGDDIPRIARLLEDDANGLPVLGWNRNTSTIPHFIFGNSPKEHLHIMRSWHTRKVKDYARLSLRLITGESLTHESFPSWWEHNQNSQHRLWYWRQRLQDEIDEAEFLPRLPYSPTIDRATANRLAGERAQKIESRIDALRRKTAEELAGLPAEVEAKVRLLVAYSGSSSSDFFHSNAWSKIGPLRLSADRLLDLLDRKDLWEDVDWQCNVDGYGPYNRMVQRLMLASPNIFGEEHVDRLRVVLAREGDTLPQSGRAALQIGISRLLPPAACDNLDDIDTRDGALRAVVRHGSGDAAVELIRVGLPQNWPFLRQQFFDLPKWSMRHMVGELGKKPLTDAKRMALRELVFDKRFVPLWKTDGWCRSYALRAVNAHAKKEIFAEPFPKELNDHTLQEVLSRVEAALK